MKKYTLPFKVCGPDGYDLLEATCHDINVVDDGSFWLADVATGCRMLSTHDTLELTLTPEQETALKLRFGDKLQEIV